MLDKLKWWIRRKLGSWVEVIDENELRAALIISSLNYIVIPRGNITITSTINIPEG